jgi:hypothetical protein
MKADVFKNAPGSLYNARSRLTNAPRYYSLMLDQNNKANRAECVTTPHGSDPTLRHPVNGLHCIIQNHRTPVLCVFSGPTDSYVGLGRFAVPGGGRV